MFCQVIILFTLVPKDEADICLIYQLFMKSLSSYESKLAQKWID